MCSKLAIRNSKQRKLCSRCLCAIQGKRTDYVCLSQMVYFTFFLISVPLFSLPVIFLLHWNISRLFLDSAETDCNLSHLASECLKCLLSVHLIGFHFLARIHVHHVQTKPLCSYSNQDRPPLYSWLSLFLASQKAFQHELTPSESYSVDRGRPHSHYTTLVATCVLGHLKEFSLSAFWVHSHLYRVVYLWCDH